MQVKFRMIHPEAKMPVYAPVVQPVLIFLVLKTQKLPKVVQKFLELELKWKFQKVM